MKLVLPLSGVAVSTSAMLPKGYKSVFNLKELTEGHHQEWSLRLNLTQHGESHQARTPEGLTD